MAGFIEKLMGMFSSDSKPQAVAEKTQTIGDCTVFATPMREGSQFRVAGRIEKTVDGEVMVRRFIRADLFSSEEDVLTTTFRKAKQIIDQSGVTLFGDGAKDRQV